MRSLASKRGNTALIMTGVMTLVIAAFLLVMGLIMLDETYTTTATDSASVTNETETAVSNVTAESCANAAACGMNNFAITAVTNATGGELVDVGNYTIVNARNCQWQLTTAGAADTYNGQDLNVTYTYKYGAGEYCDAANKTIMGTGKFADYVDLIVLAVVIAVIISLVVAGFAMRRTR